MLKIKVLFFILLSCACIGHAQTVNPTKVNMSMKIVSSVYSTAKNLVKVNTYWYKIIDAKKKTLGYALNGTPYCKDVKGFAGPTPLMIVADKSGTIKKVSLMKNAETPGFVNKLKQNGFFDQWNGMKLKAAKNKTVDAYTGATYTGKAVSKNMSYLLAKGTSKFPKK